MNLEPDRELAHRRRARDDHGNPRGGELGEEVPRSGEHLDLMGVAVAHVRAHRLVDLLGGSAEAELLVVDHAHVHDRERLHALKEALRHLGPVVAENPLSGVRPHGHRVHKGAVDVEDRAKRFHGCPFFAARAREAGGAACVVTASHYAVNSEG